jgi:hypothetical protein
MSQAWRIVAGALPISNSPGFKENPHFRASVINW